MKKLKILFGTVILSAGLASCSSAYYASAGYASDDLYAVHDRAEISRRKQAEAEAQRAAAEARRAEWEARIAEALTHKKQTHFLHQGNTGITQNLSYIGG